jgi:mitogen-activated protein kinase 1/3
VVTRWYRAPEIILNASEYTKAIDIWSIGCIFAELLGRTAIFPGENYLDQIQRVISVLGTQSYEDICFITNQQALDYLKSLPKRSKQNLQMLFPQANPMALDILGKMLAFNPNKRYSAEECLNHPYFEGRLTRPAG